MSEQYETLFLIKMKLLGFTFSNLEIQNVINLGCCVCVANVEYYRGSPSVHKKVIFLFDFCTIGCVSSCVLPFRPSVLHKTTIYM